MPRPLLGYARAVLPVAILARLLESDMLFVSCRVSMLLLTMSPQTAEGGGLGRGISRGHIWEK